MMECEGSGIQKRKHSFLARATNSHFLMKSSIRCPMISFSTVNYGNNTQPLCSPPPSDSSDLFIQKRFGKENFEESMKIVHRMKDKDIDWSKFKYMVFDVPNFNGTYEERYNHMGTHSL